MLAVEEQRYIHEDLERIEQGIADRVRDDPKHIRNLLNRDHEVAQLLDQYLQQSQNLADILKRDVDAKSLDIQQFGADDPLGQFYSQLTSVQEHHSRYPNEQAENSEQRYKQRNPADNMGLAPSTVDSLFSGEEAYGRFFDLNTCHEAFLNLPNTKRLTYLQYLEYFDNFTPGYGGVKRAEKLTDQYFKYLGQLFEYLTSFRRRTKPLENTDKVLAEFHREFDIAWDKDEIEGWQSEKATANGSANDEKSTLGIWCDVCEKAFSNGNVFKGHLNGKKHIKAAEKRKEQQRDAEEVESNQRKGSSVAPKRLKERAVAEREYNVKRLASSMSTERSDTRVNVERKQGMTERERQQELENLLAATEAPRGPVDDGNDEGEDEEEEKIYNPLKLPLAWDGKPIPFWLYRLHGLGVEFHCEICGNFVYMGRRAFDKHFAEARHVYGLKCLGISNAALFRDITKIDEALRLWDRIQQEQNKSKVDEGTIVQMEDGEGNVMPEKVYNDLQKQGLL